MANQIPDRTEEVLLLLQQGYSREDLSAKYKLSDQRSLDTYMRRRNYRWDTVRQTYVWKTSKLPKQANATHPKKIKCILDFFRDGYGAREVAKYASFPTHHALAEFMRINGYRWNSEVDNYEKDESLPCSGEEASTFSTSGTVIPYYSIAGIPMRKTVHVSHLLNEKIVAFAEETGISQRRIIETALVEFLESYTSFKTN